MVVKKMAKVLEAVFGERLILLYRSGLDAG